MNISINIQLPKIWQGEFVKNEWNPISLREIDLKLDC